MKIKRRFELDIVFDDDQPRSILDFIVKLDEALNNLAETRVISDYAFRYEYDEIVFFDEKY